MNQYPLVVTDEEPLDLVSRAMEAKCEALNAETLRLRDEVANMEHLASEALRKMAFRFPEEAERLREQMNRLAALQDLPPVLKNVDPVSNKRKNGEVDPEVKKWFDRKKAAEEAEIRQMKEAPQGKLLHSECKKIFKWLSSRVHPDKSKDRSLHHVFDIARKAYTDYNLGMLRAIQENVKQYLSIRRKNKSFQEYMRQVLSANLAQRDEAAQVKANLEATTRWKCAAAMESNKKSLMYAAYIDFIEEQTNLAKAEADRLEQQRRGFNYSFTLNSI